jgi:L,D-transpeptidase YcbB
MTREMSVPAAESGWAMASVRRQWPEYRLHVIAVVSALWMGALVLPGAAGGQEELRAALKVRVEQLRDAGSLRAGGEVIRDAAALAELYEVRGFAPLGTAPGTAQDLLRAVRAAEADGLLPTDYHLAALESPAAVGTGAVALADLDLLRSHALLRLAHDLRYGKAEAHDPSALRGGATPPMSADLAATAQRILESGRVYDGLRALRPTHFTYRGLVAALADLRRIQAGGGWERIAEGPALRLGVSDSRVPQLRRRLAASGDLPRSAANGDSLFDASVEAAVIRFQHRHALNEDGAAGSATLRELNVRVEERIEQVRINLERARWLTRDLPETFLAVNIAGAMVYLVRDGQVVFETRAVVGKTYTRTPVFRAEMRYIDLNPTWTVPPGIVREVLADVRRDPAYLRRLDMRVLDRSGRPVDVSAASLGRYSAASFPYVFRQEPGPLNPLGQIKFVFPNPHNVYLHDTPSKHLFEREQRTFSHGCIRVHDPLRLAELVLNDPTRWSRTALEAAIEPGRTRTITLDVPLPVLILYWTASADLHGELHFYRDVYGRDPAVLRALERR